MAADLAAGTTLAGYRIQSIVGRGGMGVVYRATQLSLEREVALKLIAPELAEQEAFRARFLCEARIAASLEHPHILPVHEAGDVDGVLYLAMRLVEGGDLGGRIERDGPLEPADACVLLTDVASALDHAHGRELCHRDVKPQNVLFDSAGSAYVCDFGLAGELVRTSEDGVLEGTLAYLAPERLEGRAAGPASDLYGLACLAYELLTGSPPFVREHEAALLYAHMREEPPSIAAQGLARLDPVLAKALAKNPTERYASCADFAAALDDALRRPEPREGTWPDTFPRPATRLVGRRRELEEVTRLLSDPETRLLTLTGPGGTGKTRLALHAAAESESAFSDGLSWISLAPLRDAAYALPLLAEALDVAEQHPAPLVESLSESLAGRRCLLILDNAEHLLPELAAILALLRDIPGPTILVTSRERLNLQGELLYPVPPLEERDGIELFNERARRLDPDHDPGDPAVATLCARLDRLPLALELAAARIPLFRPAELLERLGGHLALLRGTRDADPRHATLEATITWSYELLTSEEQCAFRSLSVFAGGCTLAAAEEIAGADPDVLQSLIDKSLLRTRDARSGRRYFLLETIRQYATARLDERDEGDECRGRHTAYYLRAAVDSYELLEGEAAAAHLVALSDDADNVRAALHRARAIDPDFALRAATALFRFWLHGGREGEGLEVLRVALEASPGSADEVRAKALAAAGTLAYQIGDTETAGLLLDQAIALFRDIDEPIRFAGALNNRGLVAIFQDDPAKARACFEESLEIQRLVGSRPAFVGSTIANLAIVVGEEGDHESARLMFTEATDLLRRYRPAYLAPSLINFGELELVDGNLEQARELGTEALEIAEAHDSPLDAIQARELLAECALRVGSVELARELLSVALDQNLAHGYAGDRLHLLELCAGYAACARDAPSGLRLLGAVDALRVERSAPRIGADRPMYDWVLERCRAAVHDPVEVGVLMDGGRTFSLARASELAAALLSRRT